jgi:hypothetical protein
MARQGWTPERRKKFQATMAKKRGVATATLSAMVPIREKVESESPRVNGPSVALNRLRPLAELDTDCLVDEEQELQPQEYHGLKGAWLVLMGKAKAVRA